MRRRLVVLLVAALAVLAAVAPAALAAPDKSYVSLGDSYTAGPVIPLQIPPFGCLKSDHNYPHLAYPDLARTFNLRAFRDPSCSGAETKDMTQPQNVSPDGPNPPQFDSLDDNSRIVSIGIGGNDIGFSEIVQNCTTTDPEGTPCQDHYVHGSDDEISDRIQATAPKVADVLNGIHQRSPKAEVYVVNYLPIFPETGDGCWPQMPVAYRDVPYLRAKEQELNKMLADQAAGNHAHLVDAYTAGIGHDACQTPLVRWVEPAVPVNPAAPIHPNLAGMEGTAKALIAAVNGG